ncbi:MAG TPA: putative metal-dependent hydrolase [Rhodothermales bacterium]
MSPDPRYPIGRFHYDGSTRPEDIRSWIDALRALPDEMAAAVEGLTEAELDTPYREGGWTVRQVVHHVVDSHTNSYMRLKLGLTEDRPTIRPYNEKAWAETAEYHAIPVSDAVAHLRLLHARMVALYESMAPADFHRILVHPESGEMPIARLLALYAWHGRHHVAHIRSVRSDVSKGG